MSDAVAYLEQPGLRRPLARARAQVERLGRVGGTIVLEELSAEEASALSGLLAALRRRHLPRPGRPFRLSAFDLDLALAKSRFRISLEEALELVGPPLDRRPQRKARERAAAERAWTLVLEHPLCRREPRARGWLESLRARGLVTRVAGAQWPALLTQALDLGMRLPPERAIERTRLATEIGGDPHALDDNRPLARLMVGQLAARAGLARPAVAVERRALWQRFGVVSDLASADVLTLGLRPLPRGPLARSLHLLAGGHVRLTIGQLASEPLRLPPGIEVFVCENPAVLTAAEARLGPASPPLVCTDGWPNSASWTLLALLAANGARIRQHGDFDWGGVRIAALLRERFGAVRWRFDAESYRAGVARHRDRTVPLEGRAAKQETDPELVAAMQEIGLELHEQAVLDELLADLG